MSYDWKAALVFIGLLIVMTSVARFLVFQIPALERMRKLNHEADRPKLSRQRFKEAVKRNSRVGLGTNLVFYIALLPFCVNLKGVSFWQFLIQIVSVLMLFDFFYYLTHRFIFHGKTLRRVHALHHRALTPTYIDALYVHPLETFIGLVLFLGSIPLVALVSGNPLNALAMVIATLIFTQVNTINHTYVNLPYFPFKTLHWVTSIHAAHHVTMNRGNFATLTMLYDWLFGTLEEPVQRPTP